MTARYTVVEAKQTPEPSVLRSQPSKFCLIAVTVLADHDSIR